VAVDGAGYVYVADSGNSRIEKFTPDGQFAASIGQGFSITAQPDQLSSPQGVTVAPDGTIYASDQQQRRVQHYTADGAFLGTIGSRGSGNGQFETTGAIAAAPDGSLYVADWSLSSIQGFSAGGAFLGRAPRPWRGA
jgi:tripartite motif-containing protein 71